MALGPALADLPYADFMRLPLVPVSGQCWVLSNSRRVVSS